MARSLPDLNLSSDPETSASRTLALCCSMSSVPYAAPLPGCTPVAAHHASECTDLPSTSLDPGVSGAHAESKQKRARPLEPPFTPGRCESQAELPQFCPQFQNDLLKLQMAHPEFQMPSIVRFCHDCHATTQKKKRKSIYQGRSGCQVTLQPHLVMLVVQKKKKKGPGAFHAKSFTRCNLPQLQHKFLIPFISTAPKNVLRFCNDCHTASAANCIVQSLSP